MAKYAVCKKCEQRHSTLVRHKCPATVAKRAAKDCEITEHDIHEGTAGTDLSTAGDGMGKGDKSEGKPPEPTDPKDGEGEGEGDGKGKGEGDGEGEDDGEGEGEGEGPAPQPPEPEAPPVAVVVTVLKFIALTAESAEAFTKAELTPEGILIVCLKGDHMATALLPWTEFEQRSTLDGEFWAKEVIDTTAREVLEKAEAEPDAPEDAPEDDGWIKWDAVRGVDVSPVDGDQRVQVVLRSYKGDRTRENSARAASYTWGDVGSSSIAEYRLID